MSPDNRSGAGRAIAVIASIVVAATIVAAVMVIGSPGAQREIRLDQRRVNDLQHIAQLVELHARHHDALPPDLASLARQPGQRIATTDPVDATPYGYEVTAPREYRLCASFATDTAVTRDGAIPDAWSHGRGRHCFDREVGDKPTD
jgi:hypothetical protein